MFNERLQKLRQQHLLRELTLIHSPTSPVISMGGRTLLHFASNDYLGLANHPQVKLAAIKAIEEFGVGAGASRLLAGTMTPHHQLERDLAQLKGVEASLSFSSGYATNIGVIPTLAQAGGVIFADRLCHASLIDGCRLSRATLRIFSHNDLDHLRRLLSKQSARIATLIVTEGVFSMDGDLAPLQEMGQLAKEFSATLLVDDAHGTGVMGKTGRGTAEHYGLDPTGFIHMGTLSKAFGSSGGFVAGTHDFVAYLINTSRSFIYSTAPPPAIAAAARAAMTICLEEPERRAKLWRNRNLMAQGLLDMGYQLTPTKSPILPILVKGAELGIEMSNRLREEGMWIPVIRPPTVPRGTSRLRVTVTAEHSPEHIETALRVLKKVGTAVKVL